MSKPKQPSAKRKWSPDARKLWADTMQKFDMPDEYQRAELRAACECGSIADTTDEPELKLKAYDKMRLHLRELGLAVASAEPRPPRTPEYVQ